MSTSTVNHYPSRQQQHLLTNSTKNSNCGPEQLTQDNHSQKSRKKSQSKDKNQSSLSAKYEYTEVFVWGDDSFGQLGLYHQKVKKGNLEQNSFKVPKSCSFNILIKQVSCGDNHSAILTNQGHLYMMGCNQDGQLGIGDNCPDFQKRDCAGAPCLVDSLREIKVEKVECGSNFTITLGINNNYSSSITGQESLSKVLYGWGFNENGQIGLPFAEKIDIPMRICTFDESENAIVSFSCGKEHTLFTNSMNQVYATGSNNFGQLCITSEEKNIFSPTLIKDLLQQKIVQASAGYQHSLFLSQEGVVFGCGSNQSFQLGITDYVQYTDRPIKIQGLQNYKIQKIEAKSHSAAITQNGELFLWGKGIFGQYRVPQKILTISNKVTDVSLGQSLGAAVDDKGLLWTWGGNQSGELGVGDNDPRVHPYPVLTLKGKTVSQIHCGGQFVIALGQNIKKDIPGLKLKKPKEGKRQKSEGRKTRKQTQQTQESQRRSEIKDTHSLSKSKMKNSSSSKLLRKNSIQSSLTKIYGNQSDYQNSGVQSPKSHNSKKIIKVLQKRHSKSSINKSKISDIPKSTKSKIRVRQSMIGGESQPFSGEDTSMISHSLNTTYHNQKQRKNLSNLLSQISNSSPQTHKPQQPSIIEHPQQQYEQIQMVNNSSNGNKERVIRDLQDENKQIKNQHEITKKELRQAKQQIDQFEKQLEKQKIQQQQNQELQTALMKLRLKKQKVKDLKKQLSESFRIQDDLQKRYDFDKDQKDQLTVQKDQLIGQVELVQSEYCLLHNKYSQAEQKLQQQDQEIQEFQTGLHQISEHSKDVEHNLLQKLQEITQKYQESTIKQDFQEKQQNQYLLIQDKISRDLRESQFHIKAVEQENIYLREEIERTKYSKDKDQYYKFVSGLVQLKSKPMTSSSANRTSNHNDNQENKEPCYKFSDQNPGKSPFKEIQTQNNTFTQPRKSIDNSTKKQQLQDQVNNVQQSQVQPETDWQDLKMSYNQKLLKSLEKKTTVNRINRL